MRWHLASGPASEALRCFEPLPQRLGQPRRRAACSDGDENGVSIHNGGQREIAGGRPVDGVDEHAARLEPGNCRLGLGVLLDRDNGKRSRAVIADDIGACTLEQTALGGGRFAVPQKDDGASLEADKEWKTVHRRTD